MYDKSDPRASLTPAAAAKPAVSAYAPADYLRFYEGPPQQTDAHSRTWLGRGQNAVIGYTEAKAGAEFAREGQIDEWALLLPDPEVKVEFVVDGVTHAISGYTLTFVPPGDSVLRVVEGGRVVRLFTTRSADFADATCNAAGYREPRPNIPPFMVNYLAPNHGPRDITKLSPHHHDDFEQYSLSLRGAFIHHLRWAWTPNMKMWREDEHEYCGTPSVAVIPPPAIHTTRALDPGLNQLVDIFSPPRVDFSLKPGWVLNAADYPMPSDSAGGA
jgi:hypothetical protein